MGRSDTIRRLEMKKFILALVATLCFLVLSGSGRVIDTPELEARVGVVGVVGGGTGLKTATITIGADANSGYVVNSAADTWANIRGAASGVAWTTFSIKVDIGNLANIWTARSFSPIPTADLPDGAIIVSATYTAECNTYSNGTGSPDTNVYLVNSRQASCTAVATTDFPLPLSGGIELWSDSPQSVSATGTYTWTLNATGIAAIQANLDAGECTKIGLMGGNDYNDVEPTEGTDHTATIDDYGDANEPYLTITYR
jgi:hypothetical protein